MSRKDLKVDPERNEGVYFSMTGISVRAKLHGKWGSHDIAVLEKDSLLRWLAEWEDRPIQVLLQLLDHKEGTSNG